MNNISIITLTGILLLTVACGQTRSDRALSGAGKGFPCV